MLVIDKDADVSLLQALKAYSTRIDDIRCIYFKLAEAQNNYAEELKEFIIERAHKYLTLPDLQAYFCDDGDIFIIARNLSSRIARPFMSEAAENVRAPLNSGFAELIEIGTNIHKLVTNIQGKIERREKKEKEAKRQEEQKQAQAKKASILTLPDPDTYGEVNIEAKRNTRESAEIMIIEDDPFSRRLVANVLSTEFNLTGLGEADTALVTYARIAPNILFLDINLPHVTGHELLEKIIALALWTKSKEILYPRLTAPLKHF